MELSGRDLSIETVGDDVRLLHSELVQLGFPIPDQEREDGTFGEGTREVVLRFQTEHQLRQTGVVNADTAAAINRTLDALTYRVEGTVASPDRVGVSRLRVEIIDRNVDANDVLGAAVTDERGRYSVTVVATKLRLGRKTRADLQAKVYAGETSFASDVHYNARSPITINIRIPADANALPSEYETLRSDLSSVREGPLLELEENDERQDITYLANKTGWDARAVALTVLAEQFSANTVTDSEEPIEAPFYYALFRAGVPANESGIYQVSVGAAVDLWKQALAKGVIPAALVPRIAQVADRFRKLAAEHALRGPTLGGVSSLKDMLAVSLGDEPVRQQQFAELYAEHRRNPAHLWAAVRAELGDDAEKRLRLDGRLGVLTRNNASLIRKLHDSVGQDGLSEVGSLVEQGYYRAEKWRALIGNDVIPSEVAGDSDEEKRGRYAEVLAAQVRLSFPTRVVAEMIRSGQTPVAAERRDQVQAFFDDQRGKFEIGLHPVQRYVATNQLPVQKEVVGEIARIQRVYQITPSDDAMNALLASGIDSALAVSRYDRDEFVRVHKDKLGGEANARVTHAKAQQVHNIVLNLAASYMASRSAPQIGVHSPPKFGNPQPGIVQELQLDGGFHDVTSDKVLRQIAEAGLVAPSKAAAVLPYATLEGLFGEMDYCACEHCRSVLSPAAYLVDLLQFLDIRGAEDEPSPLDLLLQRRPDIENLPLTCENTNTPLPYIDIVNETLEHYVANGLNLVGFEGHSTDATVRPEELLATPQFVQDSAYEILAGRNPAGGDPPLMPPSGLLPFHQPLEALRRYFDEFDSPLADMMEALRRNDDLERTAPSDSEDSREYGWRDILMEELRLSRAEYALLTDGSLTLQHLYGFTSETSDDDVLFGVENAGTPEERRFGLSYAKAFARRLGVTYEEIARLLETQFLNPNQSLIPRLEKLGVPFSTLRALKEGTIDAGTLDNFEEKVAGVDASKYDDNIKEWVTKDANYKRIMGLITLADPTGENDPCTFDNLEFRYTLPVDPDDPNPPNRLRPIEFHRLFRFIRLWKKLGWTIEQTDKAIMALAPGELLTGDSDDSVSLDNLDQAFLVLLPRLGILKRVMRKLKLREKRDLLPLLACFAPIDTHGADSLYRQMFLSPAPSEPGGAFADDGFGDYFATPEMLLGQSEELRAAFGLTDQEFRQLAADLPIKDDSLLSLESVSAIFRRGWLARKLKLSVSEFLLLVSATGINPFAAPDPAVSGGASAYGPILRFVDLVERLRESPLKPQQLLYLIWNQDISGTSAPSDLEVLDFARTLRASLTAIESEFGPVDDPDGQVARARMALVYGAEATDFFFGLLDGTMVNDVAYDHGEPELEAFILAKVPGRIKYDDLSKRLSFRGVMTEPQLVALKEGTPLEFEKAVEQLFDKAMELVGPFFDRFPELRPLQKAFAFFGEPTTVEYTHPETKLEDAFVAGAGPRIAYDHQAHQLSYKGVLDGGTRDDLKALPGVGPSLASAIEELFAKNVSEIEDFFAKHEELEDRRDLYLAANDDLELRRSLLFTAFLPELIRRRKRQQALMEISTAAKTELEFASAILDSARALSAATGVSGDPETSEPALQDLTNIEEPGLSAKFFAGATAEGSPIALDPPRLVEANLFYPESGAGALPANPVSAIWSGYLEAPENGFYNISVEPTAPDGSAPDAVILSLDGEDIPPSNESEAFSNSKPIELRAGTLYSVRLKVENITAGLRVRWQTKERGWEVIPPRYLYSAERTDHLRTSYIRYLKVASLAAQLKLTSNEIKHFAEDEHNRVGESGWLNSLPVVGSADSDISAALLAPFEAVLKFARLKAEFGRHGERLLTVLKDPLATMDAWQESGDEEEGGDEENASLLVSLARWDADSLDALLLRFGKHLTDNSEEADWSALRDVETFWRIHHAFGFLKNVRVSAAALIAATTNEPSASVVQAFKAALRARYEDEDWLSVLRPINDEMRALQRDALVAYILHQMRADPAKRNIDTPEKLFEDFLMDVQMDPCMQTSRIRHALSSVQLFIERCFMNLEVEVEPSVFKAKQRNQWQWMKRYRVWEANRKVFLWPENWLEPELRLDQSPFFKEAMSELVQSDITEDRAATALLNYLAKLEEVAKLEPCGIHYVEGEPGMGDGVAHVVSRTAGAGHKYFHRRYDGTWTPWEEIKLDIDDKPVVPVVWDDRLFVFWLRVLEKPDKGPDDKGKGGGDQDVVGFLTDRLTANEPDIEFSAMLYWSELYNGKWQAPKTSDPRKPLYVKTTKRSQFDRSRVRIAVHADSSLRLTVYYADTEELVGNEKRDKKGTSGDEAEDKKRSFVLHNTHSAPLHRDVTEAEYPPGRILDFLDFGDAKNGQIRYFHGRDAGTDEMKALAGGYDILKSVGAGATTVQPTHRGRNPWSWPFLWDNSDHGFYVTTEQAPVPLDKVDGYGDKTGVEKVHVDPLITVESKLPGPGPVVAAQTSSTTYSMRRFLSEDAHINRVLPMTQAVLLEGVTFGPAGRVATRAPEE